MKSMRSILKGTFFITMCLALMGNEECDKEPIDDLGKPNTGVRILKKRVELGRIMSNPLTIQNGDTFDFQYVANVQMYHLLMESERYVVPYMEAMTQTGALMSQSDFKVFNKWSASSKPNLAAKKSEYHECLLYTPQVKIGGAVRSFRLTSGVGMDFGMGPGLGVLPELSVDVKSASLNVGLDAYDPLSPNKDVLATGEATEKHTRTDLGLKINFGQFRLGPRFFFESDLSKVTQKAFIQSLNKLNEGLDEEPWYSRVVEDYDTHLVILGGSRSGIRIGDQFEIYNEEHQGNPCSRDYLGSVPTDRPVAVIEITQLGADIARGLVLPESQTFMNPEIGSLVKVKKLVEPEPVKEEEAKPVKSKMAKL